jgi:DMSO/TMAO reductase YedYZ molybdopterin-dependent catalytic subunit
MMKKNYLFISIFLVFVLLTACAQAEETILTVGEQEYCQSDLVAIGVMSIDYTNKDGETSSYEGVSLSALLSNAGVDKNGSTVTFTAADGYKASMEIAEALACTGCIVAFDGDSLRTVMPDFSGKLQVKEVISISVE